MAEPAGTAPQTISVGGRRLAYRLDGDAGKPLLVLSNSIGSDYSMWDAQVPLLGQHFQLLRYDTRGHGASERGSDGVLVRDLANDVVALLDALIIQRAHFCGLSLGGATGIHLAVHFPERINRLVLANTGALIGTRAMWQDRAEKVMRDGVAGIADAILARWFSEGFMASNPAAVATARAMMVASDAIGYAQCCLALAAFDLQEGVARIEAPTLVISGKMDIATPPASAVYLNEHIPGSRLVELEAAHLSNIEQPQAFCEAVRDFLSHA